MHFQEDLGCLPYCLIHLIELPIKKRSQIFFIEEVNAVMKLLVILTLMGLN
jgi:hypothetical protein